MCSSAGGLERAPAPGKEERWISAGTAVLGEDVSTLFVEPRFLGFCSSKKIENCCSDFSVCSRAALRAPEQANSNIRASRPRSQPGDSVLFQMILLALVLSGWKWLGQSWKIFTLQSSVEAALSREGEVWVHSTSAAPGCQSVLLLGEGGTSRLA